MKRPWKSPSNAGNGARPRSGHQSIRGRISAPVPIPSPMDDQFPLNRSSQSISSPSAEARDLNLESATAGTERTFTSPPAAPIPPRAGTAPGSRHFASPTGPPRRTPHAHARANTATIIRSSTASADISVIRDNKHKPQRKQSTLRGALDKLFGRKRRAGELDSANYTDSEPLSTPVQQVNHRSMIARDEMAMDKEMGVEDPQPLVKIDKRARYRPFPTAESKRSASLPITEFDRALRSHTVRPEDVRAIESARNSLSAEFGLMLQPRPKPKGEGLAGLSPRPASSQGRESKQEQYDEDPEQIGRAITSDFTGYRRRSRSLSGLPEAEEDNATGRRRSDEIRYWRESYDPAFRSPVSTNAPEMEDSAPADGEGKPKDGKDEQKPPLEPFRFDNISTLNELSGMKITHAVTLESRLYSLEDRVHRLEHVLNQACEAIPNFHPQFDDPPDRQYFVSGDDEFTTPLEAPADKFIAGSHRDSPHGSNGGLDVPDITAHDGRLDVAEGNARRPTSTATIKGSVRVPSAARDVQMTMDHYATLLALIHTERSAREALEAQVKSLGYQVNVMAKASAYFEPPPTAKSFGDRSAFDHDDDGDDEFSVKPRLPKMQTFDPEDSGFGTIRGDESEYSENFETPLEEGHAYGAFGEVLKDDPLSHKKSARTLSLSQLTHSRKAAEASETSHPQAV